MSIVGFILLFAEIYFCFYAATSIFISKIPLAYRNYWTFHHPSLMAIISPISIIKFKIIPDGYGKFYLACLLFCLDSIVNYILLALSFYLLSWSWAVYIGIAGVLFLVYLLAVPKSMSRIIQDNGPFAQPYIPDKK